MMAEAKAALGTLGKKLAASVPALDIYLHGAKKLPAIGEWLKKSLSKMPAAVGRALQAVASKANDLADWVDELLAKHPAIKPAGVAISAALFAYIWFNVVEISWDIPEIIRGFLGRYSFTELLQSLPEAGLGLVVSLLFPGLPTKFVFNAFFPMTIALRVAWLAAHDYGTWDGHDFKPDADALGLPPDYVTP